MTGSEAWSIIAPILAAHSKAIPFEGELNPLDQAYVLAFGALKEYDERRAGGGVDNGREPRD